MPVRKTQSPQGSTLTGPLVCSYLLGGSLESFGASALAGANEESHSSRHSANERLQPQCSLETRVNLYQSAIPN